MTANPLSSSRRVPAWMFAVSEHSVTDYVYVLDDEADDPITPGGKRTRLLHRLTPVREVGVDGFGNPTVVAR